VAVAAGASAVVAPLAGTIAAVLVAEGDEVEAGQLLATLEAMKMEHRVTASASGKVARVAVQAGDVVAENDVLVELG
jgi:methylmalonyl-CoA carboxyltransferase small subunit